MSRIKLLMDVVEDMRSLAVCKRLPMHWYRTSRKQILPEKRKRFQRRMPKKRQKQKS